MGHLNWRWEILHIIYWLSSCYFLSTSGCILRGSPLACSFLKLLFMLLFLCLFFFLSKFVKIYYFLCWYLLSSYLLLLSRSFPLHNGSVKGCLSTFSILFACSIWLLESVKTNNMVSYCILPKKIYGSQFGIVLYISSEDLSIKTVLFLICYLQQRMIYSIHLQWRPKHRKCLFLNLLLTTKGWVVLSIFPLGSMSAFIFFESIGCSVLLYASLREKST